MMVGCVGKEFTTDEAARAARIVAINLIGTLKGRQCRLCLAEVAEIALDFAFEFLFSVSHSLTVPRTLRFGLCWSASPGPFLAIES